MDTFKITCFLTLARLKNYTTTGTALHISQPAVSKNITGLELELGVKLFIRSTHGVSLTPAGEYMYDWFQNAENEFKTCLSYAKCLEMETLNTLAIGVQFGSTRPEITRALNQFRNKYPDIELSTNTYPYDGNIENLLSGKSNVILSSDYSLSTYPQIHVENLYDIKYYFIFSKSSPLASKLNLTVSDFKNEVFLISGRDETLMDQNKITSICSTHGFTPKMSAICQSLEAAFGMAGSGLGVICFDSNQIVNYVSNPHYKELLCFYPLNMPLKFSAAWVNESDKSIQKFVSYLKKHLGQCSDEASEQ